MQYVLLIYHGSTPLPGSEGWMNLSKAEQSTIYADYNSITQSPGVSPGLPLGLPQKATTVQTREGKAVATDGPFVGADGAVGGYIIFEADSIDAAIELAGRIPAARLGGAIEVRPVETYW